MGEQLLKVKLMLLCAAAAASAGCGLSLTNGGLSCSSDGKCPNGYHCAVDNSCWKNGQDPLGSSGDDMAVDTSGGPDLGGNVSADLEPPPDLMPILINGQVCTSKADCVSGNCADGVCCDAPCTESCKSCNQTTNLGKCTELANGANPAHGACGPDSTSSCGRDGVCDGNGACRKYGATTVCIAGSCNPATNQNVGDSKCDGAGHCVTPTGIACDPYVCNAGNSACYASCTSPAQCKGGTPCSASQCGPKTNGSPCGGDGECMSGNCVDSTCCNKPQSMCNGCQACNIASSLGTCTNVPTGSDPHNTCPTTAATCTAGGCSAGACTPAASSVTCSSTCASTNQLTIKKCSGTTLGCNGSPMTSSCPSSLVCANGTSCAANCSAHGDADCLAGYYCAGGNCTAKLADGSACTGNNQCTSGACNIFYRDADGDGYGTTASKRVCGSAAPAGYVTNSSDCCDADNQVHPNQTAWFTTAANAACGANFYDYDCSNGVESQYGSAIGSCVTGGTCTTTDPKYCQYNAGWQTADPGCGNSGAWLDHCDSGFPCQCGDGSCGAGCGGGVPTPQTQACH
jgi:hypothetical protein